MSVVLTKTYPTLSSVDEREILRYAGIKRADEQTNALLSECLEESLGVLSYKVCYAFFSVNYQGDEIDFGAFKCTSNGLKKTLNGAKKAVVFAATVGVALDRLIEKYSRISPTKALLMQAIGTERIECLCDVFCADLEKEEGACITRRFSAGYGDLPLDTQTKIFSVLDCPRKIGLFLNESLMMSPSKSVTAIVGFDGGRARFLAEKCHTCTKKDCLYRE